MKRTLEIAPEWMVPERKKFKRCNPFEAREKKRLQMFKKKESHTITKYSPRNADEAFVICSCHNLVFLSEAVEGKGTTANDKKTMGGRENWRRTTIIVSIAVVVLIVSIAFIVAVELEGDRTPARWHPIENWNGTVGTPIAPEWRLTETWDGIIEAPHGWRLIESWTSVVEAPIGWGLIETWHGAIEVPTGWQFIEEWAGTISTPSVWSLVEMWTGGIV